MTVKFDVPDAIAGDDAIDEAVDWLGIVLYFLMVLAPVALAEL